MNFDKEWEVEATNEIRTSFFATQRKKHKKKHTSILKNYARDYIPIAVPTVTRLRTYIAIQKISRWIV